MGQYYRVVLESNGVRKLYDPYAYLVDEDGIRFVEPCGAKLTEHSAIGNPFSDGIANVLFTSTNPQSVAWVGDYANEVDGGEEFYIKAYGTSRYVPHRSMKTIIVEGCEFDYTGKFLLNYTKGEFVSYDYYLANVKSNWKEWNPENPLVLLTAVGNGQGCGDYSGKNRYEYATYDLIGRWAGDLIKISSSLPSDKSWTEIFPQFVEYLEPDEFKEWEEESQKPDWQLSRPKYIEWCEKNNCLDKPLKQRRLQLAGNYWL